MYLAKPAHSRGRSASLAISPEGVCRTLEQASQLASLSPQLGTFVAELRIPARGSIRFEFDTVAHGHCTLWGDPDDLLARVISVIPLAIHPADA